MNSTTPNQVRSMVQNPTFILAGGIQRIRMINRASLKLPNKVKIRSCEYYLKERSIRKKTLISTQIPTHKMKLDASDNYESSFRSQSTKHLSELPELTIPISLNKANSRTSQLFGPYIEKFLSKKQNSKQKSSLSTSIIQSSSALPPLVNESTINSYLLTNPPISISPSGPFIMRSRSENIFIKLQDSISNELE